MLNYNNAVIEGFITHDAISKTTKTGKSVLMFMLAINHCRPDENNDPRVSFVDVELWEDLADKNSGLTVKGKRVLVIGSLRQDRWEDELGKMKSRIKIVGNEIRYLN
jgi:single-strand DNA-binding protein